MHTINLWLGGFMYAEMCSVGETLQGKVESSFIIKQQRVVWGKNEAKLGENLLVILPTVFRFLFCNV